MFAHIDQQLGVFFEHVGRPGDSHCLNIALSHANSRTAMKAQGPVFRCLESRDAMARNLDEDENDEEDEWLQYVLQPAEPRLQQALNQALELQKNKVTAETAVLELRKKEVTEGLQMILRDQPMKLQRSRSAERVLGGVFETRLNVGALLQMQLHRCTTNPDHKYKVGAVWLSGEPVQNLDRTAWYAMVSSWSFVCMLLDRLAGGLATCPGRIRIIYGRFIFDTSRRQRENASFVFGSETHPKVSIAIMPKTSDMDFGWGKETPTIRPAHSDQ
jgi:hypothetical protein